LPASRPEGIGAERGIAGRLGGLAGVTPQGALAAFGDPLYLVMHFL